MTDAEKLAAIEQFLMQPHKRNSRSATEVLHFIATSEWPQDTAIPGRLRNQP